jgi:hypothetical protein
LLHIWLEYINTKHRAYAERHTDVLWLLTLEILKERGKQMKKDTDKDTFLEFTG